MAAYCLPKQYASKFLAALKAGTVVPEKLTAMTSAERRTFFEGIVGPEHAAEVNSLYESKLLLKDQQAGLVNWAKKLSDVSEPVRKDILDKINSLKEVLQPEDQRSFLADLAAKKLGTAVTADEAKALYTLSQTANMAKEAMNADLNPKTWTAYGRAQQNMVDYVNSLKPQTRSLGEIALDIASIPKSILTLGHTSAPLVQSWGILTTKHFWTGLQEMFKFFADEENYRDLNGFIIGHPDFKFARDGQLGLTKLSDALSAREETIQSTLLEKGNQALKDAWGVPNVVRASNRAFTGYLNYIRFNRFTDLLNAARLNGEDVSLGSKVVKDIAGVVNNFSGRGSLGPLEKSGPVLNALFFAPRKVAGTIQMFNPVNMLNPAISPTARRAAAKQLGGSLLATGAAVGLAKAMGVGVNFDPTNADFMKLNIGNEKLDVTGGNAIYVRLLSRLIANHEVTATGREVELGQGYKPTTRADLVAQYARGKLAPAAGLVADALYGTDPVGRPFSVTQEMRDKLVPITMNSFLNLFESVPKNAQTLLFAPLIAFGAGLESPLPGTSKRDIWGEPSDHPTPGSDPANLALRQAGYSPTAAPKNIRGVKLNDEQYDLYQQYAGRLAKAQISKLVQQPQFSAMPVGAREEILRKTYNAAKEQAATRVMMQYPQIVREAQQAKQNAKTLGTPAAIAQRAREGVK